MDDELKQTAAELWRLQNWACRIWLEPAIAVAEVLGYGRPEGHTYPPEVTTEEAATILGVSKDTVLRLKKAGLIEWRNAAPPGSARPIFRFTRKSVEALRTSYETDSPPQPAFRDPKRHRAKGRPPFKHIRFDD